MPATLIGAHMPTAGGLHKAVQNAKEIGCTALQVFTSSPQMWHSKDITQDQITQLDQALTQTGIGHPHIVSHDSYLINLCATSPETQEKSIKALTRELTRCGQLGIPYVVSHMGAHMKQGEEEGLRIVAEKTAEILKETPPEVTLLMETTAGQGTCLNHRFEHLATLLDLTKNPKNLAVCLDTCHIFAAGYDIRTPETYEATFAEFDRLIGCDRIKAIHCNDSKHPLGSKKDRHENLGEGEIGPQAFISLVNDPRWTKTPILIETPEAETNHQLNVQKLWDWIAL